MLHLVSSDLKIFSRCFNKKKALFDIDLKQEKKVVLLLLLYIVFFFLDQAFVFYLKNQISEFLFYKTRFLLLQDFDENKRNKNIYVLGNNSNINKNLMQFYTILFLFFLGIKFLGKFSKEVFLDTKIRLIKTILELYTFLEKEEYAERHFKISEYESKIKTDILKENNKFNLCIYTMEIYYLDVLKNMLEKEKLTHSNHFVENEMASIHFEESKIKRVMKYLLDIEIFNL